MNETAKGFSKAVDDYEAGRPGYPAELVAEIPLPAAQVVVELGAGTGKFTRLMLPHVSGSATVVAVEPVAEMAAKLAALRHVNVLNRTAADTGLEDGSADVVVCAQSFHWFDDQATVTEIARILRPGGALALIWNLRDDAVAWVGALSRLVDGYAGHAPRAQTNRWQWILRDPRFRLEKEVAEAFPQRMTREQVYARVFSTSFVAGLPATEKQILRGRIAAILRAHELSDAAEVTMPYVSHLYLLERR